MKILLRTVLLSLCALLLMTFAFRVDAAPPTAPIDIKCNGRASDSVKVVWIEADANADEFRIERRTAGGSWSEQASVAANGEDKGNSWEDTGVDTSSPNHEYRVRAYNAGDDEFSSYSPVCSNPRISTTDNFRIFYGIETEDSCPDWDGNRSCLADDNASGENIYVTRQKEALEGTIDALERIGFDNSAADPPSGLDKIPINIEWCDGGGCAGGGGLGIAPSWAETAFDLDTRAGDPRAWIVAEHEVFHFQQYQYGSKLDDPSSGWIYEAQARASQDKLCIGPTRLNCEHFDDIDTGSAGYVGQVNGYLGNTNRPITEISYSAALFWAYLMEQYGQEFLTDDVEYGIDIMIKFWEQASTGSKRDGIAVIDDMLDDMGYSDRFKDAWKNFAVANYAKDITGDFVPSKYQYIDMAQAGGTYATPNLMLDKSLALGEQIIVTSQSIAQWGAAYYEVQPAADVPVVDITFTQDSPHQLYYTVLAVKNNDLVFEENVEGRHLDLAVVNDDYDSIVVIVAGLDNPANFRYSFNGTLPTLDILSPRSNIKARVGDQSDPEKFLLQVEVVDEDGVPLAGIDLDDFGFMVGTQALPASNIVAQSSVMGQHWFVLRAPVQTSNDPDTSPNDYDLTVTYGATFTDTEPDAISYIPRTDADTYVLLDRSGSMGDFGKLPAAQQSGRLFIDSWRNGDQIGVITYNSSPNEALALTPWTDSPSGGSRQDAFDAIDSATATGGTAIGDTVQLGWDTLVDDGDAAHDWALVLLSDGKETTGSEDFEDVINAIGDSTDKKPVVHVVAVGPDDDRPLMQWAAAETGGTFQYVSTPAARGRTTTIPTSAGHVAIDNFELAMDAKFRSIAAEVIGQQPFFSFVGPINNPTPTLRDNIPFVVDGSAGEMVLSISWEPSALLGDIILYDPDSNIVMPAQSDSRHLVWRVPAPEQGTWLLQVNVEIIGRNTADADATVPQDSYLPPYYVHATLSSQVTMDVILGTPATERKVGVPMPILATLTDESPITGAVVSAEIERPNGTTRSVRLYDDGLHGDGAASDGVYANTYYQTGYSGMYNVLVTASGYSGLSGLFTREKTQSFYIYASPDSDFDGLPDDWERLYGTQVGVFDSHLDPDNDGATNNEERNQGTDPFDSDSDDGGEGDDTDYNPHDPSDDYVKPTRVVAYAGSNAIQLRFTLHDTDFFDDYLIRIYRGDNRNGPYTLLTTLNNPGVGTYVDTQVSNEQLYCYQLVFEAGDVGGYYIAAPSVPACATPNADPNAPHGSVAINDGDSDTQTRAVQLSLWATDLVDPHTDQEPVPFPELAVSGVTLMRISNHADMSGGVWEPYATTRAWQLDEHNGLATVYVQYRDGADNVSEIVQASIRVDAPAGLALYLPLIMR